MTESSRSLSPLVLGPRGWAVLVLTGGAALSAPFLRNPGNPHLPADAATSPSEVDFSKKSWPDLREKTLIPNDPIATKLSEQDWAELERLKANSGTGPRRLTGNLPSTSATPLPSWADRGPRIDQLVNSSIRTEPLAPTPADSAGLDPLRPWMGTGMRTNIDSPVSTPNDNGVTNPGSSGDYVFRAPNPDARWNSAPLSSPDDGTPHQDALQRASSALANNRPFRKFEDRVRQWPDEKMLPSQVDGNQFNRNQLDPGQVAWGQPNSPHPNSPRSSDPQSGHGAYNSNSSSFAAPNLMPETVDAVSAPMVSSQSGRQVPRLNGPAIEAPKPASPTAPRQKHFIQQPAKRA